MRRQLTHRQGPTAIPDGEGTVEAFVDFDSGLGVGAPLRSREELQEMRADGEGVVIGHGAQVLKAEDGVGIQVLRPWAVHRLWLSWGLGEPRVVAGDEVRQEGIGCVLSPDVGQAQFTDQAILEGAEDALDTAFGLGAGGGDPLDAELLQHAAHLSGSELTLQLFFQRPVRLSRAREDTVAIRVGSEGQAGSEGDLAEDLEVGVGTFLLFKPSRQDLTGCIVDDSMQDELWTAVFEPGVMTGVALQEHPDMGHAIAPAAMAGRPAGAGTAQARRGEDAAHGGARDVQGVAVAEQLGEMHMVHPGVGSAGQGEDACADWVR